MPASQSDYSSSQGTAAAELYLAGAPCGHSRLGCGFQGIVLLCGLLGLLGSSLCGLCGSLGSLRSEHPPLAMPTYISGWDRTLLTLVARKIEEYP